MCDVVNSGLLRRRLQLPALVETPLAAFPVIQASLGNRGTGRPTVLVIFLRLFRFSNMKLLRNNAQNWRIHEERFEPRRTIHRKIDLFHEDNLMFVVPMMQDGVEGVVLDVLAHQEKFALGEVLWMAIIRQIKEFAE